MKAFRTIFMRPSTFCMCFNCPNISF